MFQLVHFPAQGSKYHNYFVKNLKLNKYDSSHRSQQQYCSSYELLLTESSTHTTRCLHVIWSLFHPQGLILVFYFLLQKGNSMHQTLLSVLMSSNNLDCSYGKV